MKDKLENFFTNNKDAFDYLPEDAANNWDQMERSLRLRSGTDRLRSGTDRLRSGTDRLRSGTDRLRSGTDRLRSGTDRLRSGTDQKPRRFIGAWATAAAAAAVLLLIGYFNKPEQSIDPDYSDMVSLIGLEKDQYFPDLTLQNPDGEMIPLSTLNAQVVLVDFWASYSMVCNEENCYYFKPLYDEYRTQGFEIYSVSMDSSAISWKNAIQNDGLDWVQVSDLKGFDSPVREEYDVETLPTNYLLDRNGKIIAKNIDVADLEGTLQGIFAMQ